MISLTLSGAQIAKEKNYTNVCCYSGIEHKICRKKMLLGKYLRDKAWICWAFLFSGPQWKMGVFERRAEVRARPSLTFFYSSVSAVKYSEDFIFSNSFPKEVLGVPTLSWRPLTVFFWHWGKYESMRLGSFGFIVAGWESGQCFMKIFYSFVFFILFCQRKLENVKVCSVGSFGAMERFYGVKPPLPAIEVWNHTLGK